MSSILGERKFSIEVLKEPRGILRLLQWIFSLLAFATCSHYSTVLILSISCVKPGETPPPPIPRVISYPFRVNEQPRVVFGGWCGLPPGEANKTHIYDVTFPGNFASDSEFFVFTGVICWLFCFVSLAVYLFYGSIYSDDQKNYPKVDFVTSALMAIFWLAGSAAWANSLSGLKRVCSDISKTTLVCQQLESVTCESSCSRFSEGNISVLIGFLNCFLWSANLWFLYKETTWFKGGNQATGQGTVGSAEQESEQEPSPFQ